MEKTPPLPEFKTPPVVEVVCGISFTPLANLLAAHIGLLWERFRADYPNCQEAPPLVPIIEQFGQAPSVQVEFSDKPPLPRTWFVQGEGAAIIQIQQDRFLHNWKKVEPADAYPRYSTVMERFRESLSTLDEFVEEQDLGSIDPLQYEMTYVNHIPRDGPLAATAGIGTLFPDFTWRTTDGRFLPEPESMNWRTSMVLPKRSGRLHTTIRTAIRRHDSAPLFLFELTARGLPEDKSRDAMWNWFDLAHEWIVRGFTDLTGKEFHQKAWRRSS